MDEKKLIGTEEKQYELTTQEHEITVNPEDVIDAAYEVADNDHDLVLKEEKEDLIYEGEFEEIESIDLNDLLKEYFDGKIVKKDLSKRIKEGANVPTYVLEYLLGKYCSSDDEDLVQEGIEKVKNILSVNYVRPDENQQVLARLREQKTYSIIDKVTVKLDIKKDMYLAEFSSLGIKDVIVSSEYVTKYEKLLNGGIWCMIKLEYQYDEKNTKTSPVIIKNLQPIQLASLDLDGLKEARGAFNKEQWMDVLLRSIGMEPDSLTYRQKWLHIMRLMPLVENNINQVELGPRSTGKSHVYKEISPNSILVSGGQATVANLFYNLARRQVGLVGMWDCVTFDEVAGMNFDDPNEVQIMKDYMASGSFSRGREEINAKASMVFVGNINDEVSYLLTHSTLFAPFPSQLGTDTAFLDRIHCYLPGWEIPKYKPTHFTDEYGLITDYISEFMREMRKYSYSDAIDRYFKLGEHLNQRDTIAVRKMTSALVKLMYPHGIYAKDEIQEILEYTLEMRRRVKEQLKILGGNEFADVDFSYIDKETSEEIYITCPENQSVLEQEDVM